MAVTVSGTNITFNDGTTQSTAFGGVSGMKYVQFGSSGTFTVPSGVTTLRVLVAGGGGGGSGLQGYYGRYMNGGSGAYAEAIVDVTPGQSIAVTVGSGGNGGTGSNPGTATGGGTGGTSSFGSFITCTGGQGGYYNTSGIYQGANGTVTLGTGAKRVFRSGWSFAGTAGVGSDAGCGFGGAGAGGGGASGNSGTGGISNGPGASAANSTGTAGTNGGAGIEGVNSNGGAATGGYAGGGGGGGGAVHIFY